MKIEEGENKFKVLLSQHYKISEFHNWKKFLNAVLLSLSGFKANIITLDPMKYSIGTELKNSQKINRKGREYLISWDVSLTEEVLSSIAES